MRKEAKKQEKHGFSNSAKTNPEPQFRTYDFLSTTNNCTIGQVEQCQDKDELKNLIVRRQPDYDHKIEAGGALNYLNEAYKFIMAEEKLKSANKQKLTAMEKNKLALTYMEMRQEADIRHDLCHKYKLDPEAMRNKKTKTQREADDLLREMEEAA